MAIVSRGRALLNFLLRRNGYPTLYLDLGHREKYLDAVEEGNNEQYQPIIEFLCEVYVSQHRTIIDEIIGKIREGETDRFPQHQRILQELTKIREAGKEVNLKMPNYQGCEGKGPK